MIGAAATHGGTGNAPRPHQESAHPGSVRSAASAERRSWPAWRPLSSPKRRDAARCHRFRRPRTGLLRPAGLMVQPVNLCPQERRAVSAADRRVRKKQFMRSKPNLSSHISLLSQLGHRGGRPGAVCGGALVQLGARRAGHCGPRRHPRCEEGPRAEPGGGVNPGMWEPCRGEGDDEGRLVAGPVGPVLRQPGPPARRLRRPLDAAEAGGLVRVVRPRVMVALAPFRPPVHGSEPPDQSTPNDKPRTVRTTIRGGGERERGHRRPRRRVSQAQGQAPSWSRLSPRPG